MPSFLCTTCGTEEDGRGGAQAAPEGVLERIAGLLLRMEPKEASGVGPDRCAEKSAADGIPDEVVIHADQANRHGGGYKPAQPAPPGVGDPDHRRDRQG